MNIKKIVSAITAFALSATMFAGFTVHAATTVTIGNGTDTAVVESYTEGASVTEGLQFPLTGAASYDVTLTNAIDISSGQIEITWDQYVASNTYTDGNNNARTIIFLDSNGGAAVPSIIERNWGGLYFNEKSDANHVGGETKNGTVAMKLTVKTNDEGKRVATLTGPSTTSPEFEISGTDIKSIRLEAGSGISQAARVLQLRDMTVTSKVTPAFELSANEVTVDANTTTATVNVTGVVGDVTVESDDAEIATAAYNSETGVITVEYVANGVATVTVTATSDGLTKTEEIEVTSGAVENTTVTVQYVNTADTTEQLTTATTIAEQVVGDTIDLTDYIDDVTSFTRDGIEYTAAFDGTDVSAVEVTKDMVYQLKYNLTEDTYDATITTAPYAQVVVTGTTTSGAEFTGTTVNSTGTGTIVVPLKQGTYNVAVTKGGYAESATNALEVSKTGAAATVTLTALDSDVLYYEDFNTTGAFEEQPGGGQTGAQTGVYSGNGNTKITMDNAEMALYNGGGGARSVSVPMRVDGTGFEISLDVTFPDVASHILFRDSANQVVAAIERTADGAVTIAAPGTNYNTSNANYANGGEALGTVNADVKTTIVVKIDKEAGIVTATMNGTTAVITDFAKADGRASYDNINSMFIGSTRYKTMKFDNIIVKTYAAPVLTVAEESAEVTVPTTDEVTATLAAEDNEAVDEKEEVVDLTDVKTLYIKVANVADENVVPCITLADETVITPVKATANTIDGATYFVYQFVGIDLEGAVVTYEGAANFEL